MSFLAEDLRSHIQNNILTVADLDIYGLRKQQMELLTLCAVRGLLTTRTRLRKALMQPPDNVGKGN